jgi:hypothetical protein
MSENWQQRDADEFKIGDTIENPANGASETVTMVNIINRTNMEIQWTGWHVRSVLRTDKFWRLEK